MQGPPYLKFIPCEWQLMCPCILQVLSLAKGFRGRSKNCIRVARERVEKALQYAYRDRKAKKRDMRSLWIQRVNAASKEHGVRPCTPCSKCTQANLLALAYTTPLTVPRT